jgi:predicted HTH domain antitoxin
MRFLEKDEKNGLSSTCVNVTLNHADIDTLNKLANLADVNRAEMVRELFRAGLPIVMEKYNL